MAEQKSNRRAHNFKDLTGQRFGKLVVTELDSIEHRQTKWACQCDCGSECTVLASNMKRGLTTSCGCHRRAALMNAITRHGHCKIPEFHIWRSAKERCFNPKATNYRYYGGRGITMCPEWSESFEQFYRDMGQRPEGLTLERRDVNGNYEASNCYWASWHVQANNRRK